VSASSLSLLAWQALILGANATLNPDRVRQRQAPAPSDAEVERWLDELVKPAVHAELEYHRQLGLRSHLLSLPVIVSAALAMIRWQVPGVCTAADASPRTDSVGRKDDGVPGTCGKMLSKV
jgi:hypothetical protein